MNSHPLDYSFAAARSMEQKTRHPPPMILTPQEVPEFLIPRSPRQSIAAGQAEERYSEPYERRRSSRLSVPRDEPMRGRSHSSPSNPDVPRFPRQESPRYSPDPEMERESRYARDPQGRKHSYQPQRAERPSEEMTRKFSRDATTRYNRHHSFSPADRRHLLSPDGQRRRLPPTPEEMQSGRGYDGDRPTSRPSSRQLPSPPVIVQQLEDLSPPRCPSGTGRRLPSLPVRDLSNGFRKESRVRQAERDISISLTSQTPPMQNNYRPPLVNGYPPDVHESGRKSPGNRRYCQRRPSDQSLQDYVETACTCAESQASSLSPSQEQLLSHSSSDTEDPSALGIAPEVYQEEEQADPIQSSASSNSGFAVDSVEGFPRKRTPPRGSAVSASSSWSEIPESGRKKTGLGLLHFCVQYFPVRKRLRVSIMKAEGLAGQLRPDLELHTFVKICLMPGKIGKESSRIVKRNRNAVFNQEFFFDNVSVNDIKSKSVSIKVCHHIGKQFQKDIMIGEIDVPLKDFPDLQTKKEIRLTESLKPKLNTKVNTTVLYRPMVLVRKYIICFAYYNSPNIAP